MKFDNLDLALLRLAVEQPRVGSREHARILGVARGTVQARIARLEQAGVIMGYPARISPEALGFAVQAFVHLHLAQGELDAVSARLAAIPEVIEAHSTTGEGDLVCRVVATDNAHLEELVQELLALAGVVRTRTEIALKERIAYRVLPLLSPASMRSLAATSPHTFER